MEWYLQSAERTKLLDYNSTLRENIPKRNDNVNTFFTQTIYYQEGMKNDRHVTAKANQMYIYWTKQKWLNVKNITFLMRKFWEVAELEAPGFFLLN